MLNKYKKAKNKNALILNQIQKYTVAYIAIGTNKGNRIKNILNALKHLAQNNKIKILKVSTILKNPPQEGIKSGYFLNGAVKIKTALLPLKLLSYCKRIELKLGRKSALRPKQFKKTSRIIDLDILLYGNRIINLENLTVPHPKLHKRYFVLYPLSELTKSFIHPVYKTSIFELLKEHKKKYKAISLKSVIVRASSRGFTHPSY